MALTPIEEQLSELGIHRFFLGELSAPKIDVASAFTETTLPQLDRLIAESDDPIYDELSRASVEITLDHLPLGTMMTPDSLQSLLDIALHGPERFGRKLEYAPEGPAFLDFVQRLKNFVAEHKLTE